MTFAFSTIWKYDPSDRVTSEAELFSSLDRVFEMTGEVVSPGRYCEVIKLVSDCRDYYVKRYRVVGKRPWKALGRSRPLTEYRNLSYFSRVGIPVPRVIGYGSQRLLGLFRRGAIITEGIPQAIDLQTLQRTQPGQFRNRPWLHHVLRMLAGYVRRMHEDGFTHGDLKCRNILVTTGETPRVVFIDCPSGSHKLSFRHGHFLVKDLACLDRSASRCLSRTARLRFYLWYRNQTRLTPGDKELIAKVIAARG